MAKSRLGATPQEWYHFNTTLGLTKDLLPVVCDPSVPISPISTLKTVGKTPSRIVNGYVMGIPAWTEYQARDSDIRMWITEPRYALCVIARHLRAIDVDITDAKPAKKAWKIISEYYKSIGVAPPPRRVRADSSKFLVPVIVPDIPDGLLLKQTIRVEHGIVEILGNRQQFLVAGTHTGGCRYEWQNLGTSVPELTNAQFTHLISELHKALGVAPILKARDARVVESVDSNLFNALTRDNLILSQDSEGAYNIICPFEDEHSENQYVDDSSTQYFPAHTGGHSHEAIKCLHAHCAERNTSDFAVKLGITGAEDFEDITHEPTELVLPDEKMSTGTFRLTPVREFSLSGTPPVWLCEDVLPFAELGMLFGDSGSGKTFLVYDLICAIARGVPWFGQQTLKGRVLYVCAEGQNFFRNRIRAYAKYHGLLESDIDVWVVEGRLDLTNRENVDKLITDVRAAGLQPSLVVMDTYALCMSGDENDGRDVNKVIQNCKRIRKFMGAMVLLVHHAGKTGNTGERGHSSLRGACDVMLECLKDGDTRGIRVSKMKDGNDRFVLPFVLEDVFLGVSEDAKAITSCVVVHGVRMPEKSTKHIGSMTRKWQSFETTIKAAIVVVQQSNRGIATIPKVAIKVLEHYGEADDSVDMYSSIQRGINKLIVQGRVQATDQGLQIPYSDAGESVAGFEDIGEESMEDPLSAVSGSGFEDESLTDPGGDGMEWA